MLHGLIVLCAGISGTALGGGTSAAERDAAVLAVPTRDSLLAFHQMLASEPHVAGSPGDARVIEHLQSAFKGMGYEVERHEFWPLLARPIGARVEIVAPETKVLAVRETALDEDAFSAHPEQMIGWNAYSGNGDVTAGVVYANYGTKADFERLAQIGVQVRGKVVVCRYGGNFRGYKAKFAQIAGAAGVIIYGDPADRGFVKGPEYPQGPWANSTCIERGSIGALDYPGDPLTPGVEATKDAKRLDEKDVDLPRIPVQPLGYAAVQEILSRMAGRSVAEAGLDGWKGGLPTEYRVEGGDVLRVRLKVEQSRSIMPTANVIARITGSEEPEKLVIVGCHHDAWNCGAADPLAGTICLLESARSIAELVKSGARPRRTIVFAAWGAEEFSIVGSTEWVEAHRGNLMKNAVAYINLDMAAMGVDFGSSASPSLRRVIAEAAAATPQARGEGTALAAWLKRGEDPLIPGAPKIGDIGGGSDHIGFLCHAGVASCGLGAGGSAGNSYHSVFDTLPWYWKAVGEDYEPAKMVTRATSAMVTRLAYERLVPLDPGAYGPEVRRALRDLTLRGRKAGVLAGGEGEIASEFGILETASRSVEARAKEVQSTLRDLDASDRLSPENARRANEAFIACDRAWLSEQGLPGRPWFKNLIAASDEDSGYAAWPLPALRWSIEHVQREDLLAGVKAHAEILARIERTLDQLNQDIQPKAR